MKQVLTSNVFTFNGAKCFVIEFHVGVCLTQYGVLCIIYTQHACKFMLITRLNHIFVVMTLVTSKIFNYSILIKSVVNKFLSVFE